MWNIVDHATFVRCYFSSQLHHFVEEYKDNLFDEWSHVELDISWKHELCILHHYPKNFQLGIEMVGDMGLKILDCFKHSVLILNQWYPSVFWLLINECDKVFMGFSGHARSSPYNRINKIKTLRIDSTRPWKNCYAILPKMHASQSSFSNTVPGNIRFKALAWGWPNLECWYTIDFTNV